jgi:hypothetical protein
MSSVVCHKKALVSKIPSHPPFPKGGTILPHTRENTMIGWSIRPKEKRKRKEKKRKVVLASQHHRRVYAIIKRRYPCA